MARRKPAGRATPEARSATEPDRPSWAAPQLPHPRPPDRVRGRLFACAREGPRSFPVVVFDQETADTPAFDQTGRALVELEEMGGFEMRVEGRLVLVDLVKEDMVAAAV